MNGSKRADWVTEGYEEKLDAFTATHETSRAAVEAAFREHCEMFRSNVMDGTSQKTVRQLAYRKLQWHPPEVDESAPV